MGILRHVQAETSIRSRANVDELWRDWIQKERLIRLGWAVYV